MASEFYLNKEILYKFLPLSRCQISPRPQMLYNSTVRNVLDSFITHSEDWNVFLCTSTVKAQFVMIVSWQTAGSSETETSQLFVKKAGKGFGGGSDNLCARYLNVESASNMDRGKLIEVNFLCLRKSVRDDVHCNI